jgi:anhydro-N-acetylmuramic acid kinase
MRLAMGFMTGTSLDALDAALVQAEGTGLSMRVRVLAHATTDLGELRSRLRALASGERMDATAIAATAVDFGRLHAQAARRLADGRRVDLAAVHGQTVMHAPPLSWQLVNPWPVAEALGCAVASDLRGADLVAGGQGAPITPLADWVLFRGDHPTAVVNLGGFCNVTLLPEAGHGPQAIAGMDVCPCNHLLDAAARKAIDLPYDPDGRHAARGHPNPIAADDLLQDLRTALARGRSLGSGDEGIAWFTRHASLTGPDLLATVVHAVGNCIGQTVAARTPPMTHVLLAGGGARNRSLWASIARILRPRTVDSTALHAVPIEAREAAEMAVLGLLAWDGVPITLPAVTRPQRPSHHRDGLWCLPRT